ncbi:MAG: S1C family serine protease [Oscillospiraceae bacterium]|jgi:serine protease Do|nr:S1C family serine protease [Oscillospiraceae bacterium]
MQDENYGVEFGEQPTDTQSDFENAAEPISGEYSFKRDELPGRPYMDANYHSGSEMECPKSYYTPPRKIERTSKPKKKRGLAPFIAACLICALLGGVGGGAIVAALTPEPVTVTDYGGASLKLSSGIPQVAPNPDTVAVGTPLTGAEIYALGCEQAVGITTEITYQNYFGMESAAAVTGSGFIVTENGYIVTNYHVVQVAYEQELAISVMLFNGDKYPAEIVGFEKSDDVAVLKIAATGLPAATLGNSGNLLVGDPIYAIGNPLGELNFSMSTGSVSALNRSITTTDANTGEQTTNTMFQIDAAVNSGNSGGPAYNNRGEVVGIVAAKYSKTGVEGLGFAIPIDEVKTMVSDLVSYGYVTGKPSYGVKAKTVSSVAGSYFGTSDGAEIVEVIPGGAAEKAGVKVGDIVTAVNGIKISSSPELVASKDGFKPGDTVTLTLYRDGDYLELPLTFGEDTGLVDTSPEVPETPSDAAPSKLPSVPKTN